MSNRTSRAARGTIASFFQYGLQLASQAILAPLVLRFTGAETLGAYGALMQAIGYLALVDLGFGVALSRFLAQAHGLEDQKKHFRDVVATSRTYFLGTNLLFAGLLLVCSFWASRVLGLTAPLASGARLGLYMLAAWSVIRTPAAFYGPALLATQNLAAANLISGMGNVCRAVFAIGLTAAGAGLAGLIVANILAEVLTYGFQVWHYRRCYPRDRFEWGLPDRKLFRDMFRFGAAYFSVNIASRLTFGTDNLLVGAMFGLIDASVYYTTQMPALLLMGLIWKLADNAFPAINELFARKSLDQVRTAYLRLVRYSLLMGMGLAAGLISFNGSLISLWVGSKQYGGNLMTLALAVFCVGEVADHVNALVMVAYGRVRWLSIFTISSGALKLGLAFLLKRTLGPPAVMIASALVEIPLFISIFGYTIFLLNADWRAVLHNAVTRPVAAVVFCLPVMLAFHLAGPVLAWGSLIAWAALFSASWAAGVLVVGLVPGELKQISSSLFAKAMPSEIQVPL